MRLWHYDLLDVLPRQQLCSQLRECVAIAKDIYEKGQPNHILVNKVKDYSLDHFKVYCSLVIDEMGKRGYKVSKKTKDKLNDYIKYYDLFVYKKICGDVNVLINNEYEPLFDTWENSWHDDRYLVQCLYNLEEKYDCGGMYQEDWDKIYNKYSDYIDY